MTIFREYGPFKGIHNSTSNLAQKQGYVLRSENMIVDHDTGDLKKRPGAFQTNALTESFGVARFIRDKDTGEDDVYIVGTKNRRKTNLMNPTIDCSDFLWAATFPAKGVNDSFSSFLHSGNLYYNYGDFIYKWDGKRAGRAGKKLLVFDDLRISDAPTPNRNFKFLIQTCDANNDVAELSEATLENSNAFDGSHQTVYYGILNKDDVSNCMYHYNSPYFVADQTKAPFDGNSVYHKTDGLDFIVPASSLGSIAIGDFVLILSRQIKPQNNFSISSDLLWRGFEVKNVVNGGVGNRTVEFKNPYGLEVFIFGSNANFYGRSSLISNVVVYPYLKVASSSVYNRIDFSDRQFLITWSGHCIYPQALIDTAAGVLPDYGTLSTQPTGLLYEPPEYERSSLPRGKHISLINGLMIISSPKVFSFPTLTVPEEFDYQAIAWSSENPEDPIETWGGMSAIIGTEDEGKVNCTFNNNGGLVIFKDKAIYVSDAPANGVIEPQKVIGASVGCKHPESIQECDGVLLFYCEGKGFYMFRAGMAQAKEASGGFRGMFKSIFGKVKSIHDIKGSRYICSIGTTTFVYDYILDSWWIWKGFNFDNGVTYYHNAVMAVGSDLKMFILDENVLYDTFATETAISSFVLSQWFMGFDPETDKKLKALRIWCLNGSGAAHVDVYKNFREITDYSFDIKNQDGLIDIGDFTRAESGKRKFKAIAFKISNATIYENLKITGWAIDYEPTGIESKNFEGAR